MRRAALACVAAAAFASTAAAAPRGAQRLRPVDNAAGTTTCGANYTPKLIYGNGALIQHVKVFDVFYAPGNPYKEMLASFYKAVTQSAHFDMLQEYDTPSYKIGRGSYLGMYEDSATATKLSDTAVQTYLSGLIDAHKVPPPDDDIIYMIYFPSTVSITQGGGTSCVDFCAYHNSFDKGAQHVRYGVLPDLSTGGCATGCGPSQVVFENITDVSSHELVEAVTDPEVPDGWYDNPNSQQSCGEIGDICATGNGETGVVNGFTVQKEWSNQLMGCIATNPAIMVNDFSVAVTPAPIAVPVGGSATASVKLTKVSGMAENVALAAAGVPTGLTASFSPASVSSDGGSAVLTVSAGPAATVGGMQTFQVKATGSIVSPTVDVQVTIVAPPDMAMAPGAAQAGGDNGNGDGNGNGNGLRGNGASGGCTMGGAGVGGGGAGALLGLALFALALALRRRQARARERKLR